MTIHELLQAAGLTANDEIPIWDADGTGEPTKKITAQQLAAAVVALANLVTGVKGNAESSFRTGDVNLTPANIGAVSTSDVINVAHGGTNANSATGARQNFFPDDLSNESLVYMAGFTGYWAKGGWLQLPLPLSYGGTGATTPAAARANLGLTPSTSQTIATGIYITKIGNLAFIGCYGNNVIALPPRTWVTLGYLPNGYVPFGHFFGTFLNGGSAEQSGIMHITESGTIQYFNSGTAQATALWGSMIFPISNN
jgi:hypothetical protein